MEEITCPNCNVDADPVELKQNNLRCPTCGFDLSDQEEPADLEEDDEDEDMVPMRAHEVFLLRRLPVLIAIAVGLAIFIGTAYIGSSNTSNNPSPFRFPTTIACHTVEPGSC